MTNERLAWRSEPSSVTTLHRAAIPGSLLDDTLWMRAQSLDAFIDGATQFRELWKSTRRLAHLTPEQHDAVRALGEPQRLLVLTEDWCGDAIHTLPFVQRVVEASERLELRVLRRDEHDDLMDAHLSGTSRSIPVVIAYDAQRREHGWWGPRPSILQQWVKTEGLLLDKTARYKAIRTWYARDRGASTVREVLQLLHHISSPTTAFV